MCLEDNEMAKICPLSYYLYGLNGYSTLTSLDTALESEF